MSMPTFNPPIAPSVGAKITREVRLLEASFGDGYTQVARDGTNHIRQSYELTWEALSADQAGAIITFLDQQGGDMAFLYTLPGKAQMRFTCKQYQETLTSGGWHSVTATLKQSFNLS
jgi:phage-related protein